MRGFERFDAGSDEWWERVYLLALVAGVLAWFRARAAQ
jgi:hypothetical protein